MSILDRFGLDGKTSIITGAGRGIGRALAIALAEAGSDVVIADLDTASGMETAGLVERAGRRAEVINTDVADPASVAAMVEQARSVFGRIDVLVNNAGVVYHPQVPGGDTSIPIEDTDFDNWRWVMSVNIDGMFICTQAVGRTMLQGGHGGTIINIASMSGFIANKGRKNSAYCTSKGAVVMFTREAATEWTEHGIRINAIAPGYIKTEGAKAVQDPAVAKSIDALTPARRIGLPEDLQGAAVFLASDASDFMTGQTLVIDGGYTLW
jgi:NAD(P)-dependent dehydrogenase (short-subunit alcohol dehydrogenase family)